MKRAPFTVTIDGPAASGKSSTAQRVADALGFRHVDSGSLYRAATAARLRAGGEGDWTEDSVLEAAECVRLSPGSTSFSPVLDGRDAEDEIRGADATRHVSAVAKMKKVRRWVDDQVRAVAAKYDVVVDGRDIGTVVLPGAQLKIFLVADEEERARRRVRQQLEREGTAGEIAAEAQRIRDRDALDASQTVPAPDAVRIDTTRLTQPEQITLIVQLARDRMRPEAPIQPVRATKPTHFGNQTDLVILFLGLVLALAIVGWIRAIFFG